MDVMVGNHDYMVGRGPLKTKKFVNIRINDYYVGAPKKEIEWHTWKWM